MMKKTVKWGTTALAFAAITINTAAFAGGNPYYNPDVEYDLGMMDLQFNWTTHQSGDTVKANEPVKIGFEVGNAGMYLMHEWQYEILVNATLQSWDAAPGIKCERARSNKSKLICSAFKPMLKYDPFLKGSITVLPPAQSGRKMLISSSIVAAAAGRPDQETMRRDTNRANDTKVTLEMRTQ